MLRTRPITAACVAVLLFGALSASADQRTKDKKDRHTKTEATSRTVDLNSASKSELKSLPGIGRATADKIIAHRPYKSIDDLKTAGVSQKTIDQIRPMVVAGSSTTPSRATTTESRSTERTERRASRRATPSTDENSAAAPTVPAPAGNTRVWVNTDTGVYHLPGDQWYGKTKHGKYMTADEAAKAGFRPAKHK